MTQPTLATQPTMTDLLAGVIDLAPGATPPHRPGPCTALCVPACAGEPARRRPNRRPHPRSADAERSQTAARTSRRSRTALTARAHRGR